MHTLLFLNPGHFHAALTLRERHPLLHERVYVYAEPGPDLDAFLALVESFNTRPQSATAWELQVYAGEQPLQRLLAERAGDAVVLAGRNDTKMSAIAALHAAGLAVLGDKPFLTGAHALAHLAGALSGPPLVADIMTSHHEVTQIVLKRLVAAGGVFGDWSMGDPASPAIEMRSVHHLSKQVNGRPLRRPAWYFDMGVQGDGVVDIPTHLVDSVQWLLGGGFDFDRDIAALRAERWPTIVPRNIFRTITGAASGDAAGAERWPETLHPWVLNDALHCPCNGRISYRVRGVQVVLTSEWRLIEPAGTGDTQQAVLRGQLSDLLLEQGAQAGEPGRVFVRPQAGADASTIADALRAEVARWQGDLPGTAVADAGTRFEVVIPPVLRSGHEAHFAMVLNAFIEHLEHGTWPPEDAANLRTKYTLLAHAQAHARDLASTP